MSTISLAPASFTSPATAAPRPGAARLRITRRGQMVLSALIAIPLVFGAAVLVLGGGDAVATSTSSSTTFEHIRVQSGDTLWSIAERVAPESDPRDVAAAIINLNQLDSASLEPNDLLAIPTQYSN
ncbi:LysM peptidoglycan-binding domain-containing protein [Schumannella sp. 10F1B-5-1]|uniref:LysM peptidoglycan-binding domain-containing protein n=1 Tax=Schumannella sp. 10F1B-5-1 TaxID=2590780 RepID=UPI0011323AD3|nr:LysM peptidoglycan-binding domain-containing protein [Schumannella sp. 10F1B-5-1]TPW70268.1 LysM peptidoglycan-binding domain-containing protein [Schumannella sp. 10F1B-5-1]